jgi:protein phosphatase
MKLSIGFMTDRGPRHENQDTILAIAPPESPGVALLIVADGMGGAKGGAQASQEAVAVIRRVLVEGSPVRQETAASRLREAIGEANTAIHVISLSSPDMEGMGCTVVIALVLGDSYWVASVGDSRAYRIRGGEIAQLTTDHTWVGLQVREGVLTTEQAARHSLRHVLERALGADRTIEVDVLPESLLQAGDVLLLCTDGLYGVISESALISAVTQYAPQDAADYLVAQALQVPTRDNVSVVVLRAE